jgi:hypothetical protein
MGRAHKRSNRSMPTKWFRFSSYIVWTKFKPFKEECYDKYDWLE